jgi:sialate O-acetylesterase
MKKTTSLLLLSAALLPGVCRAEIKLPAIFGSHMVLQQNLANPVWGWEIPGAGVTVSFAGQKKTAIADKDGKWTVKLDPVPASATPQKVEITSGNQTVVLEDVLVGEVWVCSGQSNMGFPLRGDWNGDLEAAASNLPNLRLIRVPQVGTQEIQKDFKGEWKASNPETAAGFSAVGFLFGRYIHQIVNVPVGLIDNAWGGSAAEAWIRRERLEQDPRFALLMENTRKTEAQKQSPAAQTEYEEALEKHKEVAAKAKAEGKPAPRPPQSPAAWLSGNQRPANIFNGVLSPTIGFGIKGAIWYQGESNSGRAYEYRELFPFLIQEWRREWNQGEFPFYWVQLADFMAESPTPGDSTWAELRESQTKTMALPNTGQAVITDLGEGRDIHPKNKHDVAARLVRWALAKDYGIKIPYRSPEFKKLEIQGSKAVVSIDCFGSSLRPFDVLEAVGFAVCGEDKVWHFAKGKVVGTDKVELECDKVPAPIAVRYAWANNPVCNLASQEGLPLTPFRTDDFEMITKPKPPVPAPTR